MCKKDGIAGTIRVFLQTLVCLSLLVLSGVTADGIQTAGADELLGDPPTFTVVLGDSVQVFSAIAGDLDGDNNADVVFSPLFGSGVSVAWGMEGAEFETPVELLPNAPQAALRFGLINSDTLMDLFAGIGTNDTLFALLNNGDRTFDTVKLTMPHSGLVMMETGYFDDDPYLDVVVNSGTVFFGDGLGGFPRTTLFSDFSGDEFAVAGVSDFNNDGFDDILMYSFTGAYEIWLSDGQGAFSFGDSVDAPQFELNTTVANDVVDFDRDGNADFAAAAPQLPGESTIVVIGFGDGTGHFISSSQIKIPPRASSVVVADIDRDHNLDIMASSGASQSLMVMLMGDGARGFTQVDPMMWEDRILAVALATADFDRDGNPDFVSGPMWYAGTLQYAISNLPDRPVISSGMATTCYSDNTLEVVNPETFMVSRNYRTVAGCAFQRVDVNTDSQLDQRAVDYNVEYGQYTIVLKNKPGSVGSVPVTCGTRLAGAEELEFFSNYDGWDPLKTTAQEDDSIVFYYDVEPVSSVIPVNGGKMSMSSPGLSWDGLVPEGIVADSFHFQLDCYHDFRSSPSLRYDIRGLTRPEVRLSGTLGMDSIYYWRVRWFADGAWSDFSHAFAAKAVSSCCGLYMGGYTGNTDCSTDGEVTLGDITRLISRIYITHTPLCCEENGNVDGSPDGELTLTDISALIDCLYITLEPTAACQ